MTLRARPWLQIGRALKKGDMLARAVAGRRYRQPAQMAAFPGPPGMPGASASSGNAGRRGLIIVAVLALFVAAALTFIFLRYRAVLLPG